MSTKGSIDLKENHDVVDHHLAVSVPASIAALSEAERVALDKATTRKVDLLLMPALVVLYILNYLDRQSRSRPRPKAASR